MYIVRVIGVLVSVLPIENKVWGEEHEEAPFVALAYITQASNLPGNTAEPSTRNQNAHLRHITDIIKCTKCTYHMENAEEVTWSELLQAALNIWHIEKLCVCIIMKTFMSVCSILCLLGKMKHLYFWHACVCLGVHERFLLLVTWEESLDLLDDWSVAGVSLSLAFLTPVSDKLLYCGLKLVHVKCSGWPNLPRILLKGQKRVNPPFQLLFANVIIKPLLKI